MPVPSEKEGCANRASIDSRGCGGRAGRQVPVDPTALPLSRQAKPSGGGDRRRWPSVDGADDLAAVDALQIDAGDAEVGMPELPLDHDERNALVGHFHRVSVPELMRRESSAHASCLRAWCSCLRAAEASHRRPAVGPWITHSTAPIGSSRRTSSHGSICSQAQRSIPTSRRLPPFPCRTSTAPRERSRSLS